MHVEIHSDWKKPFEREREGKERSGKQGRVVGWIKRRASRVSRATRLFAVGSQSRCGGLWGRVARAVLACVVFGSIVSSGADLSPGKTVCAGKQNLLVCIHSCGNWML